MGGLGLMLAAVMSGPADGAQIWMHGTRGGAAPCAACHGIDGHGRGIGAPALAGMSEAAVAADLGRLAGGPGVMGLVASRLTPADRAAVAAYISGLK